MASNGTIAHRFANKDYNFEKGLKGSSTHIEGRNYYSYNTVFGQWVDEKVCLVYHGETSNTSNQHKLWESDFPKDVTLFPYDDGGRGSYYNNWHGCNLLGWQGEFDYDARVRLMDYLVGEIYNSLHAIVDGKQKDLDSNATIVIAEYWAHVEKLCSMYKDTSVPKWLKKKRIDMDGTWKRKKVIVKALYKGEKEVRVLVDAAFGQGTYKSYYDYCARYRKSDENKEKMIELCHRLGMTSPYRQWDNGIFASNPYKPADIRKMTAKQRNEIHFANLASIEYASHEDERKKKYEKNKWNAYRWIVGCNPQEKSLWYGKSYDDKVVVCRNMFNGVEYDLRGDYIYGFYWAKTSVSFDYDGFRKSEDKEQWIADFYAECKEVALNRKVIGILKRIKAHTKDKASRFDDDIYLNDDYLRESTTEGDYEICVEFIRKQDKHFADQEAQRRAAEIALLKREEEERKEKEYMEQVKQEQIDECIKEGTEGCRNLWRKHLTSLSESENRYREVAFESDGDFFFGGNILLRLNLNKDTVETSKSIRIPVEVCKKMWRIVSKWHENPSCFKEMQIDTKGSGKYTISSYHNDILTAGCHDIAYTEMERMYNEILAECS